MAAGDPGHAAPAGLSQPWGGHRRRAVRPAGTRFTRDLVDLVGYLVTRMDKTAIARLCRVDWDTVGRIISRVVGERLDPARLDRLFVIGVDDVSWRKGQRYLTLVSDHATRSIVWGAEGRDAATLDGFSHDVPNPIQRGPFLL
jgi:transposase